MHGFASGLQSILLIYGSILVPVPYCFYYIKAFSKLNNPEVMIFWGKCVQPFISTRFSRVLIILEV